MPLWSVQEWRARIGTSWCALGRPIRSKSSQYHSRDNYLGSPPPGGGGGSRRRAESHAYHGAVIVAIMILLLIGTIFTLLHFVLPGDCLIVACWFECTPMDLLLVQWMLVMGMVSNDISRFISKSWSLLCCSDSIGSFLSGLEAFPSTASMHRQHWRITITHVYVKKCKRTDEEVVHGAVSSNFWHSFCIKMRSIKLCLASAVVKASLLLRCGDVEMNPGPLELDEMPKLHQLRRLCSANIVVNVIRAVAPFWENFSLTLEMDKNMINIWRRVHASQPEDATREMFSHWLNGNGRQPISWKTLIQALRETNLSIIAANVKEILTGHSGSMQDTETPVTSIMNPSLPPLLRDRIDETSKQLFQEAMCEEGHVSLRTIVLLLIGVAGAGKTCFSHLLFNKDPPSVRESTPLAQASVRAVSFSRATAQFQEGGEGEVVWEPVLPDKLNCFIADVIKGIRDLLKANESLASQPQPQLRASQQANTDSTVGGEYRDEHGVDNQDTSSVASRFASTALPDHVGHSSTAESDDRQRDVEQLFEMESVQELVSLISRSKGSEEMSKQDWIYIIDSGGQPQFHDLLPTFVRHVSAAIFFVKLNETLNDCPEIKYYSKGGDLSGRPYQSAQSHLQIIQNCLQAMQSRSEEDAKKHCPDLFFVGTHRDQEHHRETLEIKNKKLQEMLFDHALFRNHFVSQVEDHLLYQVNSKNPTNDDWKVVNNFRRAVMETHTHEVKVPIRWFVLEQLLQQLSVDDVISFRQCLEVAGRLRMKEKHLKAALTYLAKLNIFEYFPHILPNVVFTSSQVLLTKITELVEYSHYLQNSPKLNVRAVDIHFRDYGELSIGMLKRKEFSRHYIADLFEEDDLLRLWEELLVIAKRDSNTFVMPAVLSALPPDKLSDHRLPMDTSSADVIPLTLYYEGGLFPSGIFSSLISYLQSKCGWKISMKRNKPKCLCRNCVKFSVTGVVEANITLIYFHHWIELHIIDLYNEDKQTSCHQLQNDLFNGLNHAQNIQKYDNLQPKRAFFCNCKVGSDLHLASITPTMLQCSLDTARRVKLTEKCKIWLHFSDAKIDKIFSNAEGCVVQMEKTTSQKRKRSIGSSAPDLQEEQGSSEQASPPPLSKRPRKSKQDMAVGYHFTEALIRKPELHELDLLKGKSKTVKIIDSVASKWDKLATRLYFSGEDIRRIQGNSHHQSDTACRNVFIDWLGGNGREPITWKVLIEALKEAELTELAKDVRDILLNG